MNFKDVIEILGLVAALVSSAAAVGSWLSSRKALHASQNITSQVEELSIHLSKVEQRIVMSHEIGNAAGGQGGQHGGGGGGGGGGFGAKGGDGGSIVINNHLPKT